MGRIRCLAADGLEEGIRDAGALVGELPHFPYRLNKPLLFKLLEYPMGAACRQAEIVTDVCDSKALLLHEKVQDVLLAVGQRGHHLLPLARRRRSFRAEIVFGLYADGDDGPASYIVFDGDSPVGERKIFLYERQSASYPADIALHIARCRRKPGHLSLFFLRNPWSLVGKPDGVSLVEYRNDDFLKLGVDEILAHFSDGGIRNASARLLGLRVYRRCEVLYEFRRRRGLNFCYARRASEIIVGRDPRACERA